MLTRGVTANRSVATLSPHQLARKRAADREAQRALRMRTKQYIERLEREIAELKSRGLGGGGLEDQRQLVQGLLWRNKQLEAELRRLKSQPTATTTQLSFRPRPEAPATRTARSSSYPRPGAENALVHQPGTSFWDLPTPSLLPPTGMADQLVINFIQTCRRHSQAQEVKAIISPPKTKINLKAVLEYQTPSASLSTFTPASDSANVAPGTFALPSMNLCIPTAAPSPRIAHLSARLTSALCNIGNLSGIIERLGALVIVPKMVLWLTFPCAETGAALPECFRPTALQRSVPHPQWVDMVLLPPLRDIILQQPGYATDGMLTTFAGNVSLAWPGDMVDAFVIDDAGDAWLSERFVAHAEDLRNWSLGNEFLQTYPELAGRV